MSLIEDARRLANTDPEVADFCFACGNDSHKHYDDCQWSVMPRIVLALEAAERMVAGLGLGIGGGFITPYPDEQCWRCIACHADTAWVDGAVPNTFDHEPDCSGQALVVALRGDA